MDLGDPEELFDDDDRDGDRVNETPCATKDATLITGELYCERADRDCLISTR